MWCGGWEVDRRWSDYGSDGVWVVDGGVVVLVLYVVDRYDCTCAPVLLSCRFEHLTLASAASMLCFTQHLKGPIQVNINETNKRLLILLFFHDF